MTFVCVCCSDGELAAVGAVVITDNTELFVLNAATADTLLHIHLPSSVCSLLHSELDCSDHRGCVFCSNDLNNTRCRAAVDERAVGYGTHPLTYSLTVSITSSRLVSCVEKK